jgi:protein-L-isoaspartate(D-aspartate) O-methyltransferase
MAFRSVAPRELLWQEKSEISLPETYLMVDFNAARTAMVDCQVRPSDVTRYNIIDAMLAVPRENFVPGSARKIAYSGAEIELEDGRVILDPRVLGKMLDAAAIGSSDLVLNISATYGYTTALIARMCSAVIGLEKDASLAEHAARQLAEMEVVNAIIENGPLTEGVPQHGPFDVIFIDGAIEVLPDAVIDQLKEGGKVITLKIEDGVGQCQIGIKSPNGMAWRRVFDATSPLLPGFARKKAFEF